MARRLDLTTLDQAAIDYASRFALPDALTIGGFFGAGPGLIQHDFYNFTFKDEFEYICEKMRGGFDKYARSRFDNLAKMHFKPRQEAVFEKLLADHLAIDKNGDHIQGKIGTVVVGGRRVGRRVTRHGVLGADWPVYAGEEIERDLGNVRAVGEEGLGADPLPPANTSFPDETAHMGYGLVHALNTNVSIAFAQAGINAAVNLFDEGTGVGVIKGYTASQPADPDVGVSAQTLLFTLPMSATAFSNSTDATPDALATAASITADASADATATLAWCRASSSNDGAAALNDHDDGSAGTGSTDFVFNSIAIISGGNISITAWTMTQPQGPTAT